MGPGNKKQTEQDNTNLPVSVGLYMAKNVHAKHLHTLR